MDNSLIVPIIVALITLCGVIIAALTSAFVTRLISGRTLYINAVTVERSKWIEKLRGNIATCSGQLRTLSYKIQAQRSKAMMKPLDPDEFDRFIEEINKLISLVRLQLNPFGEIDRNIITILDRMPALAGGAEGEKLRTADNLLIQHSQWLLKDEWEKVKSETKGIILRGWSRIKAHFRHRRYRKFCEGAGRLDVLQ